MKLTPTNRSAVDSLRACGKMNLIQALSATIAGRPRMARYHRNVATFCIQDARLLATTGTR